ncbi:MAG: hypothetical protein E8D52_16905 [Nitrospira sp.]|nr:MAG: hypothetical protein E8D52_16905 [Nitrospira sp.]
MSQDEGSVNNQFIHLQLSNNEVTMRGAPLCDLGHKLQGTRDGKTEGIYAGWEWNGRRLRVFNDRFGFYPLYYFVRPGECAVSPSLPELLALSAPTDLDYDALAVFFHLGYFVGDDTPFQSIRAVPPSVSFEWQDGTVTMSSQLAVAKPQGLDRHQAIDAYIELFRQAIVRRLTYSEEFAILLSGGRDSRHILLELVRSGARPKFCLTVDLPVQHEDAVVAAQLAKAVDVPHTILPRRETSFGEEFEKNLKTSLCTDEHAWMLAAAQHLQGKVKTLYDGIGGDVLSAGLFLTQQRLDLSEAARWAELAEDIIGVQPVPPFLHAGIRSKINRAVAVARIVTELRRHADAPNPFSSFIFWNRTRREIALSPYGVLADVGQILSPFLDHAVYDLLAGLPARMFVDHSFHTEAINRAFPQYAHIPYGRKSAVVEGPRTSSDHRVWRGFAMDVLRHCILGKCSLLDKGYVGPRLLWCLCDPSYLPSVLWIGPPSVYVFQLELMQAPRLTFLSWATRFCGQNRLPISS